MDLLSVPSNVSGGKVCSLKMNSVIVSRPQNGRGNISVKQQMNWHLSSWMIMKHRKPTSWNMLIRLLRSGKIAM